MTLRTILPDGRTYFSWWNEPRAREARGSRRVTGRSGFDGDAALVHAQQQELLAGLLQELVHGLARSLPVAVVVDQQDTAAHQAAVKVVQFVLGRRVPVGVQPEDGDLLRRTLREGVLDLAPHVVDAVLRVGDPLEPGLYVLQGGHGPDRPVLALRVEQLPGRPAVPPQVLGGGRGHALVRVEEVEVAVCLAERQERLRAGLHGTAAPDTALDDVPRDAVPDDVPGREDEGVEPLRRGHRVRLHRTDDVLRLVVVVRGQGRRLRHGRLRRDGLHHGRGLGGRRGGPGSGHGRTPELVSGELLKDAVDGVAPSHGAGHYARFAAHVIFRQPVVDGTVRLSGRPHRSRPSSGRGSGIRSTP